MLSSTETQSDVTVTRRRIGGYVEHVGQPMVPTGGVLIDTASDDIHPVPLDSAYPKRSKGKRRRSNRRWYKRPLMLASISLLTVAFMVVGVLGYK